jgi:hypothetical protein
MKGSRGVLAHHLECAGRNVADHILHRVVLVRAQQERDVDTYVGVEGGYVKLCWRWWEVSALYGCRFIRVVPHARRTWQTSVVLL